MEKDTLLSSRKEDHLRINLQRDVNSDVTTGLEYFRFEHNALPEINLSEIETSTHFLDKHLAAPLLISSMTGGTSTGAKINANLAAAAQTARIALAIGSQRAALDDRSLESSFKIRHLAPDILLFANLGAVQLNYGYTQDDCRKAVEMIEADALILHLNSLQEALQPEGNSRFSGLLKKIEFVCSSIHVPVIVKEVGWGISAAVARQLIAAGVTAIDVSGAGGTSWSQVEMYRLPEEQASVAAAFREWGIPTADCLTQIHQQMPEIPLIASGGLRNGVDIAKCITLGASLSGMAGPFLHAATDSTERVAQKILLTIDELRIAMFAVGAKDIPALKRTKILDTRKPE